MDEIISSNQNLLLPMVLPLPDDSLVLNRRMKLALFYDFGRDLRFDRNYRAAGTGLVMPFGGDVSGVGSFTVLRMTILAVLYRRQDQSATIRLVFCSIFWVNFEG